MECSRCGLPIPAGDRVCPACGAPVAVGIGDARVDPRVDPPVDRPADARAPTGEPANDVGEPAIAAGERAAMAASFGASAAPAMASGQDVAGSVAQAAQGAATTVGAPPAASVPSAAQGATPTGPAAAGTNAGTSPGVNPAAGGYKYPAYHYGAGYAGAPYYGAYAGQPYAGQPYAGQPYAGQPYAGAAWQGYSGYPGYPGYGWPGVTYAGGPGAPGGPPATPAPGQAAPQASAGQPAYSYPYPYPYPYPYGYVPAPTRRAPGETYRLVLAWIVIAGSALCILVGLVLGLAAIALAGTPGTNGLSTLDVVVALALVGVFGGGAALYFGIAAVAHRPSVRFELPPWWIFLILTVLAIGGAVVFWHQEAAPGSALAVLPLALLAGLLPGLTILSFTSWALRSPSTRRHVIVSFVHGATLAILLALILEAVLQVVIVLIMQALGYNVGSSIGNLNTTPSGAPAIIGMLLLLSVVAPLVEEGVKPLGAVLLMPRLRGPAEAFLVGLAAGIGFDFVETVGYIGMGEADWVSVAVQRIGAGLLHGVGAGMGALGWYYLIRGKGSPYRWLLGFGGLAYAVLQHGFFNGSSLAIGLIPGPIGHFLSYPIYLDQLPLDGGTGIFFFYYLVIAAVLVFVCLRLRRLSPPGGGAAPGTPGTAGAVASGQPGRPMPGAHEPPPVPQPVQGGAR